MEKSLILKKETKFDVIRRNLLMLFFRKEYFMMQRLDDFVKPTRPVANNIIIPKEIGKIEKHKRL